MTGQLAFDLKVLSVPVAAPCLDEQWGAYLDDDFDDERDRMWAYGLSSVRRSCLYRSVDTVATTGGVL